VKRRGLLRVVPLLSALACGSSSSATAPDASAAAPDASAGVDSGGTTADGSSHADSGTAVPEAGADATVADASGGDTGTDAAVAAAGFPQVARLSDAGEMTSFQLVSIIPSGYSYATEVNAFGDYVVTSAWLATVVGEYGAATSGTSAHVSGPAITGTAVTEADLVTYIQQAIAGTAYAPDGHNLYMVYLPPGVTVTGTTYCGVHHALGTLGDARAFIRACPPRDGVTQVQSITATAGHELVEALTDTMGGFVLNDSVLHPPALTPWAYKENTSGSPHSEVGDLCGGTRFTAGTYNVPRIWSNVAAAAGGDPCKPAVTPPYYNVRTADAWVMASAGATVDVPLTGWATGSTTDWELSVAEVANSAGTAAATTPTLAGVASVTLDGGAHPTMKDGGKGKLTVTVPASAPSGTWYVYEIDSSHLDAAGAITPDPDLNHYWMVGVYVP
jgi:hypothetical protein